MSDHDRSYTCQDYRQEMQLLALRSRLEQEQDPEQRRVLQQEVHKLELELGLA
ncbi:MAG: hypothetical protein ACLFRL_03025 [Desulfohalobiaceae bacterium]